MPMKGKRMSETDQQQQPGMSEAAAEEKLQLIQSATLKLQTSIDPPDTLIV